MKPVSILARVLLAAAAILGLASCSSYSPPLRIALIRWPPFELLHLAQEKGFFGGSGFSLTLLLAFLLLPLTSFADVVHPLRIYEIFDTNKQAFHDRFRDHAMRIMAKYEFNSVAMWETKNGARTEFVYLLEWPDEAGRGDPGPDAALDGLLAASLVRLHLSLRVTCPCCDRVDDRNHCRASRPNSDSTCRPLRGANVRPDPRNG